MITWNLCVVNFHIKHARGWHKDHGNCTHQKPEHRVCEVTTEHLKHTEPMRRSAVKPCQCWRTDGGPERNFY